MSKYELIVRKKISQFIEKQFRYFGYDFDHDSYKKVVYGEKCISTPTEEKLKTYYDSYIFLLSNAKNPLTNQILNSFYYLLFHEEMNEITVLAIESKLLDLCEYSTIEKACEFHMFIYDCISYLSLLDRQIISLMFFNYILVKYDIPAVKLVGRDITKYVKLRDNYINDKESLYLYFNDLIKNSFVLEKSYLNNLKDLTVKDIFNAINEMKDELINEHHIKNIYLYGSFSKGINRFDSDIDLLVRLSLDLSYPERINKIEELKGIFYKKFKRFTDIEEVREFFSEDFIKEATMLRRII